MDKSSLSNSSVASLTHLEWKASVCFSTQTIKATAVYDVEILSSDAKSIDLDASKLRIHSVAINDKKCRFELSSPIQDKPHLGQKLSIPLPTRIIPNNSTVKVSIDYETTDECTALQWLPPCQTGGKVYPYLFSQCQAIHARTLLPCMDFPGVKMTYKASVTVPSWSTAIMSALSCGSVIDTDKTTFLFYQPTPIPAYLFAIVVAQLESRDLSSRVRVWSEPSMIEAAAYEFVDTEQYLSIAEEIAGMPYVWKRYDLLCLVPSFPYGGMENPCLTFVTPTLLAGDRSLTGVIAHEIAHSWTGNLVTNATWQHFWLNEGWTRWLESKILTKFSNNNHLVSHLNMISGNVHLKEDVQLLPPEYSRLVPLLEDGDPDDSFSSVPYEKGFQLLFFLEQMVGEAPFLSFFQSYLQKFKYSTVTSQQFQDYFCSMFPSAKDLVPWDAWFNEPGMPVVAPNFDDTFLRHATDLANRWIEVDHKFYAKETFAAHVIMPTEEEEGMDHWPTNQISCFLDELASICEKRGYALHVDTISRLGDKYQWKESKNSEILFRYCKLALSAGDERVLPIVVRFLTTQGRMKFVRPLYRALMESHKSLAVDTFLAHKNFYHPIAAKMLSKDLNLITLGGELVDSCSATSSKETKRLIAGAIMAGGAAVVAFVVLSLTRRKR